MEKVSLNGVEVYPYTSKQQLLEYVEAHKGILVAINAEKILHATDQTRAIINRNIGYCDGIGAVTALQRKGYKNVVQIPGCELWLDIVAKGEVQKQSFYLVGGQQEVIDVTVRKLKTEFPAIHIVGYRNGYIRSEEEKMALLDDIVAKKPDVVFVAMGSPKQELLMEEMLERHSAIYQGLGGSFDVYTGRVKRAPKWWRKHKLEGLYRPLASFTWPKMKRLLKAMPFWWNVLINKY